MKKIMRNLKKVISCILMVCVLSQSAFAISTSSNYPENVNTIITQINTLQEKLKSVRAENKEMQAYAKEVMTAYKTFKQNENVGSKTDTSESSAKTKKSDTFMKAKDVMNKISQITGKKGTNVESENDTESTKKQVNADIKAFNQKIKEAKNAKDYTELLSVLNEYYDYQTKKLTEENDRNSVLKQTKSLYQELKSIIG